MIALKKLFGEKIVKIGNLGVFYNRIDMIMINKNIRSLQNIDHDLSVLLHMMVITE